jgi:hypothetical protein
MRLCAEQTGKITYIAVRLASDSGLRSCEMIEDPMAQESDLARILDHLAGDLRRQMRAEL